MTIHTVLASRVAQLVEPLGEEFYESAERVAKRYAKLTLQATATLVRFSRYRRHSNKLVCLNKLAAIDRKLKALANRYEFVPELAALHLQAARA